MTVSAMRRATARHRPSRAMVETSGPARLGPMPWAGPSRLGWRGDRTHPRGGRQARRSNGPAERTALGEVAPSSSGPSFRGVPHRSACAIQGAQLHGPGAKATVALEWRSDARRAVDHTGVRAHDLMPMPVHPELPSRRDVSTRGGLASCALAVPRARANAPVAIAVRRMSPRSRWWGRQGRGACRRFWLGGGIEQAHITDPA